MVDTIRQLVYASRCEIGLKRAANEDSLAIHIPEADSAEARYGAMFIVADGIGSIGGGDTASKWAVKTFQDTYFDPELEDEHIRERVLAAIQDSQEAVKARARVLKLESLGTTLAGAVILPSGTACIFNVGDSRVYILRNGALEQITVDQSYADPKVDPNRPKLTSYLGQKQPILPNLYERTLEQGDRVLICSDGLWGLLHKEEIESIVESLPPKESTDKLIERVYEQGARDNVTICVVQNGDAVPVKKPASKMPLPLILGVVAVLIALGVAVFLLTQNGGSSISVSEPTLSPAVVEPIETSTPPAGLATHISPTRTPRSDVTTATVENGSSLVVRTATPSDGD